MKLVFQYGSRGSFKVIFVQLKAISILTAIIAMDLTQMPEYSYTDS